MNFRITLINALIICCILTTNNATAQKKAKTLIGISEFDYSDKVYKRAAAELQDVVISVFTNNSEFDLLDRSKVAKIQQELKLQKGKEYTMGKTVAQNEANGAEVLIVGNLISIDTQRLSVVGKLPIGGSGGSDKMTLTFSLHAIDVRTGVMKSMENFTIKGAYGKDISVGGVSTQSGSTVRSNRDEIMTRVSEWINTIFPPRLIIDEVNERSKSGKPEVITIISSHKFHVKENSVLLVNEISYHMIEGETKTKVEKIAELKVAEIQGDFLKCDVIDGSEALEERLTNNKELHLQLSDKKTPPNPFKKK